MQTDSPSLTFDAATIRAKLAHWLANAPHAGGDEALWKSYSKRETLTPAAVLVPIVAREGEPTILLTQRTAHLNDHAGQISFPGGRTEPGDPSVEHTALRETEEEIGLARQHVQLLGRLPEYITGTGFRVSPVVGWVEPEFTLALDAFEVAEAFEVPLGFFLDPANHQLKTIMWQGAERSYYAMPYGERYVWGATAGMLRSLYHALAGAEPS